MNPLVTYMTAAAAMMAADGQGIPGLVKGRDTSSVRKSKKERARMLTLQRQQEIQAKKGNK